MIELSNISARGRVQRGRARAVLTNVTLEQRSGVLGIIGAPKDGTSLLLDVIEGTVKPTAGRVVVLGGSPDAMRARIARVSLDAPLPETMRVDEVCDLAADVRGEERRAASERLGPIGIAALARRSVRSLALEERRAVALAIALSSKADVLLVDEPLVAMDPVVPRLVVDALRARAATAAVIVTTSSARDATRFADQLGILTAGTYAPLPPELAHMSVGAEGTSVSMRVVVAPSHGKSGAAALAGILGAADVVTRVETSTYAPGAGAVAIVVWGRDLAVLARAVTQAIATARVDVDLVEPGTLSLDAIRAALAARMMSPPPGSPPPGPTSLPPSAVPGAMPPAVPGSATGMPPGSVPSGAMPPGSVPSGAMPPGSVPSVSSPPASLPPASVPPRSGGVR